MYKIIQNRKIWFSVSGALVIASLIFFATWGLKLGIDFTGGSLLEVRYPNQAPTVELVRESLGEMELSSLTVQPTDNEGVILRFQNIEEETHQQVVDVLNTLVTADSEGVMGEIDELRFEAVGPSIGAELRRNTTYAIFIVLLAIIFYVAWSFRKVSKPVASWKYGLSAIFALFHDVIIVVGVFSVLGHVFGVEVNTPFVAALLTVLGYSVNDSIVVFDRVRENLPKSHDDFENTVNYSVNQSITRSINTSVTSMLVLLSIVILGGDSIRYFALALLIGVFIGTYSSIFLASPLLVFFEKLKKNKIE